MLRWRLGHEGDVMASMSYDVLYTTDESRRDLERWLSTSCEGGFSLESGGRAGFRRSCQYRIFFERESDIAKLCRTRKDTH